MKDSFDLQDELYTLFTGNLELMALLKNPVTAEEKDNRFRRSMLQFSEIRPTMCPFVEIIIVDAKTTKNHKVNKGFLNCNIFTASRFQSKQIFKKIKEILRANYEDMQIYSEGQTDSGIQGIYKYQIQFLPMISS